jgi:hypothetical protein
MPFGEVLAIDGMGIEFGGEKSFGFGEVVEPGEDGVGFLCTLEAAIELIADVVREPRDFSTAKR